MVYANCDTLPSRRELPTCKTGMTSQETVAIEAKQMQRALGTLHTRYLKQQQQQQAQAGH